MSSLLLVLILAAIALVALVGLIALVVWLVRRTAATPVAHPGANQAPAPRQEG